MILLDPEMDDLGRPRRLAERWRQAEQWRQAEGEGLRRKLEQGADAEAVDAEPQVIGDRVQHDLIRDAQIAPPTEPT